MTEAKKTAQKKPGRPSLKTPELLEEIYQRLSTGEPMTVICSDAHMPSDRTVRAWEEADAEVSAAIAQARARGFDAIAWGALTIASTPEVGEETITKADGGIEVRKGDMLGHRKLQIETRLKLLAKWDPKRYGEKMTVAGDPEAPLSQGATPEVIAALAELSPEQLRALASKPIKGQ